MADLPEAAEGILETELGPVKYIVNQGDHVYLDAGDTAHDKNYLLINRVPYKVSLHLHLVDGVWKLRDHHDLYMSRPGAFGRTSTASADKKALEALTEAWSEFIAQQPALLAVGEIHALTRRVQADEAEIETLVEKLRLAEADRDGAVARLRELGYHGPNKQDWSARY